MFAAARIPTIGSISRNALVSSPSRAVGTFKAFPSVGFPFDVVFWGDQFFMQKLAKVKNVNRTYWGMNSVMALRPLLASKVAQCIADWTEIEVSLGIFLALLLHANEEAVLAMYGGLENRSAQLRMIESAAQSTLKGEHLDVVSVLMANEIRAAMKYRDKLAHWCWGYSDELPEALLIRKPSYQLASFAEAVRKQGKKEPHDVPLNHDTVFVVREADLDSFLKRLHYTREHLRLAMGGVWTANTDQERAEYLQQLSNMPEVRSGLA